VRSRAIDVAEPEGIHEHAVVHRRTSQSLLFEAGKRRDAVVEVRNQHVSRLVFHACQQLGKHHRRIRSPVAIVAAVQAVMRAVERDFEMSIAARAEDHCLLSALIHRPIADQKNVAVNEVAIRSKDLFQMRRSCLFFALPNEADISAQGNSSTAKRVEGNKLREDRGFVVSRRPRVNSLASLNIAQNRREWRRHRPFRGSHRLAVVVRVEHNGVLRTGNIDPSVDNRRRTGD